MKVKRHISFELFESDYNCAANFVDLVRRLWDHMDEELTGAEREEVAEILGTNFDNYAVLTENLLRLLSQK